MTHAFVFADTICKISIDSLQIMLGVATRKKKEKVVKVKNVVQVKILLKIIEVLQAR